MPVEKLTVLEDYDVLKDFIEVVLGWTFTNEPAEGTLDAPPDCRVLRVLSHTAQGEAHEFGAAAACSPQHCPRHMVGMIRSIFDQSSYYAGIGYRHALEEDAKDS